MRVSLVLLVILLCLLSLLRERAWAEGAQLLDRSPKPIFATAASRHVVAWPAPDGSVTIKRLAGFPSPQVPVSLPERRRLVAELDAPRFASRQNAFQALQKISRAIVPELKSAHASAPSREARSRLAALLSSVSPQADNRHAGPILGLAISPDQQTIVSGGKDGKLRLWSALTGEAFHVIAAHEESVMSVQYSPVDSFFATGGGDNLVHVWTSEGRRLVTLRGHESSVHDLAFSPDGQSLASAGGFDRTVLVWDVPTWTLRERLDHPPNNEPLCVVFAPDGKRLASAGYGGSIHCWQSGALLRSVAASESTIRCLAVDADGTILFGDRDGVLGNCAWDGDASVSWSRAVHVGSLRDLAVLSENDVISVGDDGKVQKHLFELHREVAGP